MADHIVLLENHRVLDQGSWQNIQIRDALTTKLSSRSLVKESTLLSANFENLSAQLRAKDEIAMDLSRQSGDPALYGIFSRLILTDATNTSIGYYLSFIDQTNIFLLIATTALYGFFITIPQYWLRQWTEFGGHSLSFYIGGFLFLSSMSWAMTSAQMWLVL